jgi:PAS domain S-box-containing protein
LLLDATSEVRKRKPLQQKAHELSLTLSELERNEAELLQEKEELETLVDDRTLELARMNLQLKLELQEKQKVENALRESEAKFRRLYESNMIGIMFCDAKGIVTDANDVFLQMIGYKRIDLLSGRIRWDEITTAESRGLDSESLEELRFRGAYTPTEKTFICKDGSQIKLLFGAALITGEQQTVCFALNMNQE